MKVYLNVPYEEKEIAKRKGCHWDDFRKQWFIKNPVHLDQYMRWMPEELLNPTKHTISKHVVFVNDKISNDRYKRLMKKRQRKTRR